jgi:hypothetical protein
LAGETTVPWKRKTILKTLIIFLALGIAIFIAILALAGHFDTLL